MPTREELHQAIDRLEESKLCEVLLIVQSLLGKDTDPVRQRLKTMSGVQVPDQWHWPVGVSLSAEVGFQSSQYADQTWSLEIRPIIDKQLHQFYISVNPTLGIGLNGHGDHAPSFEPNVKASYAIHKVAVGVEYYGSVGQVDKIPAIGQQNHAIFAAADLDVDPRWEINFGPGWGLTKATDAFVFKVIIGRRIDWKKSRKH